MSQLFVLVKAATHIKMRAVACATHSSAFCSLLLFLTKTLTISFNFGKQFFAFINYLCLEHSERNGNKDDKLDTVVTTLQRKYGIGAVKTGSELIAEKRLHADEGGTDVVQN